MSNVQAAAVVARWRFVQADRSLDDRTVGQREAQLRSGVAVCDTLERRPGLWSRLFRFSNVLW